MSPLGLAPLLCGELFCTRADSGDGISVLLVEQNVRRSSPSPIAV
jgi:ABC-type branched-subunit amino acid transport system ATPase component